jgi:ribonuclease HI
VCDALQQVLLDVASPKSMSELVTDRRQTLAQQATRRDQRRQHQADVRQRKQVLCGSQAGRWQGWFDGSAVPNPGRIGLGAVLNSPLGVVTEMSLAGGNGDSNEAEYLALIAVLKEAVSQQVTALSIYGDSRIVIDDVTGLHIVKALELFRCQALRLLEAIGDITFHWIPRAKNSRADDLARTGR